MTGPPFFIWSICSGGGYRYCRTDPPHPRANPLGLYPLHRVLMENKLGRLLGPGEVVHHDDEDKTNDEPANLLLKTNSGHARDHALKRAPDLLEFECPRCGVLFTLKPYQYRLRIKRNASMEVTCSRSCGAKGKGP